MKKISLIVALLSVFLGNTQISLPNALSFDTTQRFEISFSSSHDIQSTSIPRSFSGLLIKGGTIEDDFSTKILNQQHEINRIGREFTNELFYANYKLKLLNKTKFGLIAQANYNSFSSGIYSQDLFELFFKGNEGFIGDSAVFSGSKFKHIDMQSLGLGLIDKETKSYLTLNLVNIQNYFDANISRGIYRLSADSSETSLSLSAKSLSTYGANFNQGLGASVNLCLNFEIPFMKDKNAYFQFKVSNFGFAKIKSSILLSSDTTIAFSGFEMDDFLKQNSSDFSNISWLDTLNVQQDTLSRIVLLPAVIQFGKLLNSNYEGNLQSFFGIKVIPALSYVPKIYAGLDYKTKVNIHLGLNCSYGGFGTFRAGIYANYWTNKVALGIGTEDFYSLISKNGFGQMFNLRMICKF